MGRDIGSNGTFIDLFAGCGGLSLGLMNAGWNGVFAIEKDPSAFETLKHNLITSEIGPRYSWPQWVPKEHKTIGRFLKLHNQGLRELQGKIDLVAGGPPCQGFSMAGKRRRDDPRNGLFKHYFAVVDAVRPNFLLLENVRGITVEFGNKTKGQKVRRGRPPVPFSQKIRRSMEERGYQVFPKLVRACDFGVAQLRPRYIMIAVKSELLTKLEGFDPFEELESTRVDFLKTKGLPTNGYITVKEAISDLESQGKALMECEDSPGFKQIVYGSPLTEYQRLMHGALNGTAPNSLRLVRHHEEIRARFADILANCKRGVHLSDQDRERLGIKKRCTLPLDPVKPSHTLTTLPDDIIHYSEPRILNVREYARLQSFPDWFEFKGKYTTGGDRRVRECPRYTQVGNAVPPLLAECIGSLLGQVKKRLLLLQQ